MASSGVKANFPVGTGFLFLLVLVLSPVIIPDTDGYNLDKRSPVLANGKDGTYFGFSVDLHREGSENMMIIGAPLEDVGIEGADNTGAVYRCPVVPPYDSDATCRRIDLDEDAGRDVNKSHQWLGATVRSSGADGVVVSCAPFFKDHYLNPNGMLEAVQTTGSCFTSRDSFAQSVSFQVCPPPEVYKRDYNGFWKGSICQAGMAAVFNEEGDIVLGAPGSYGHQGSVYVSYTDGNQGSLQTAEKRPSFDGSFQGYSVAQGRFSSFGDMNYVAGAPRANLMRGKVLIYDSELFKDPLIKLDGVQTGSYFGHGVVAEDFNNDGLDDLVVSAPFYWNRDRNKPNVGQICIFYQNAEHELPHDTTTVITGKVLNGRFGFSITSLGDINDDGVNDLAVGAPYDEEGAIFIYHGKRNGKINTVETQILRPESFDSPLVGFSHFGYSINGGRDADENEYPDLLVGDYTADKVVLVRARPVIRPMFDLTFDREGVDINLADVEVGNQNYSGFDLTACMWYTGKGTPEKYNFSVELIIDTEKQTPRASFHVDGQKARAVLFEEVIITKTRWCVTMTAVMEDKVIDKSNLIFAMIRATPLLDENLPPGGIHPVVQESSRSAQSQIHIIADCINEDCSPDLVLDVMSDRSTLHMGDTTRVTLTATVRNKADEAFQARLHATVHESWKLTAYHPIQTVLSIICRQSESVTDVQCDIGNPLPKRPTISKFNMTFNVMSVPGDVSALTIALHTNSTNVEADSTSGDNRREVEITLEPKINVTLKGSTNLPQFVFNRTADDDDEEDIKHDYEMGEEIIHNYEVINVGPGTIGNATLEVSWPAYTEDGDDYLLYLTEVTLSTGGVCGVINHIRPGEGLNPENLTISRFDTQVEDGGGERTGNRTEASTKRQERSIPEDPPSNTSGNGEEHSEPMAQTDVAEMQVANCSREYGGCVQIVCRLQNIPKGEEVLLRIRSRLQSATLEKHDIFSWDMVSSASLDIHELPYIKQPTEGLLERAMVTLSVLPEVLKQSQRAPLWAILLSIFIGLLILLLTILCLWKLGFFKRKKFDKDETAATGAPEAQAPE